MITNPTQSRRFLVVEAYQGWGYDREYLLTGRIGTKAQVLALAKALGVSASTVERDIRWYKQVQKILSGWGEVG